MKILIAIVLAALLASCGGGEPTAPTGNVPLPFRLASPVSGDTETVLHLYQALYGKAPSNPQLTNFKSQIAANGAVSWVNATAAEFNNLSNRAFAERILNNISITPTSLTATSTFGTSLQAYNALLGGFADYLSLVGIGSRGVVAAQLAKIISGLEVDTQFGVYGPAALSLNRQIMVNSTYSADPKNLVDGIVPSATANAGTNQNVMVGSLVTLDGSASTAEFGKTLSYVWTLASKPTGSTAALSGAATARPTFTADAAGIYVASLVVNDGKVSSTTGTVSVTASTAVSGLISSSTVWTKSNSPYVMTGNVLVPGGVTLSIEAGVEVQGTNFKIQTEGALNVAGTATNPVLLSDVVISPAGKQTSNHLIRIVGATFTGGSVYPPTGNAIYGSLILTDSRISNSSYIYLWYPLGTNRIERNVFSNTGGISYGIDARGAAVSLSIRNNKFVDWSGQYALENWVMYGADVATVAQNSFLSTDRIAVRLPSGFSSAALNAANNFWGTTTPSVIDLMIYDRNDDLNSGGIVNYTPFLPGPDPNTPI